MEKAGFRRIIMDTVHARALELSRLKNGEEKDHHVKMMRFAKHSIM